MALRLVQIAMNARDDSAVGRFWAEALGWGVDSEEPGVTNVEPVGFAYPDSTAVLVYAATFLWTCGWIPFILSPVRNRRATGKVARAARAASARAATEAITPASVATSGK